MTCLFMLLFLAGARARAYVCVCVCERERERERGGGLSTQYIIYYSFASLLGFVAVIQISCV